MARQISRALTKQMLRDWGITDIHCLAEYPELKAKVAQTDGYDYSEWWINRLWVGTGRGNNKLINKRIKVTGAVAKHKYGPDKYYPKVTFSIGNKKNMTITLSRLIYCWFIGDIPEGMVVDHIDNNPFNNSVDNLQLLTYEQNLYKRYIDNPSNARNQWDLINRSQEAAND